MPAIESFPDFAGTLANTDYFYVRSSGAAAGSRDKRFAFSALLRSFIAAASGPVARASIGILTAPATLDFPSIAVNAKADLTVALNGVAVGDAVFLGLPAAPAAGIVFNAFVSAANVVTIRASNTSAGAVDPASAAYRVIVFLST